MIGDIYYQLPAAIHRLYFSMPDDNYGIKDDVDCRLVPCLAMGATAEIIIGQDMSVVMSSTAMLTSQSRSVRH